MGRYSQEFKDRAVEMVRQGMSYSEAARALDTLPQNVRNWVRKASGPDLSKQEVPDQTVQAETPQAETPEKTIARLQEEIRIKDLVIMAQKKTLNFRTSLLNRFRQNEDGPS